MHGTETNTCELANGVPNTAATIGATRTPTASKKYDPFLEVEKITCSTLGSTNLHK